MTKSKKKILYYSTNHCISDVGRLKFKKVSFSEAMFLGMAPDGGLFVPDKIPLLSKKEIIKFRDLTYSEIAYCILSKYLKFEIKSNLLRNLVEEIYRFDVPIEQMGDGVYLMRLDRGPTGSFKDFGALFMARVAELINRRGRLVVLVATSGDTGSAIGNAFKGIKNAKVYIVYPIDEISTFQEKQLNSIGGNVRTIAIKGKFDDCQRLIKKAFADEDFKGFNLFSANSINISRLLPQIVYYFYAFSRIDKDGSAVTFSVPSGNFGNSLGCELARRMGLPVKKLIIATNANDAFAKFLETGSYAKIEPSIKCLSNAMNVGNPSNLARYFELYRGTIDKEGNVYKYPDVAEMKKYICSYSISDQETINIIKKMHKEKGLIIEPHGAVAIAALYRYIKEKGSDALPAVAIETAHPVKFHELLLKELKIKVDIPNWMDIFTEEPKEKVVLENDYDKFKRYLLMAEGKR